MNSPPSKGPITLAMPNTAPNSPAYVPRSRGGIRSAMTAMTSTISPPPPMPCRARVPISCTIDCESPASADADDEHDNGDLQHELAPVEVRDLAPDGSACSGASR